MKGSDNLKINFFMPMKEIPTHTTQQKGINFQKRKVYTKPELLAVKQKYMAALSGNRPKQPMIGPVGLMVSWCFPLKDDLKDGAWKVSKPDTDNMLKLLKDCMTELDFWYDDAQVCYEVNMKKYGQISGIYVSVLELEEE